MKPELFQINWTLIPGSGRDTQSPREILEVVKEDWHKGSEGVMELVLQDAETQLGYPMIIVHAKHVPSDRTSRLLSIVRRPNNPYPVLVQPEIGNLPDFLKKSYSNPCVSDTPSEFRKKLTETFNSRAIKGRILDLASDTPELFEMQSTIVPRSGRDLFWFKLEGHLAAWVYILNSDPLASVWRVEDSHEWFYSIPIHKKAGKEKYQIDAMACVEESLANDDTLDR